MKATDTKGITRRDHWAKDRRFYTTDHLVEYHLRRLVEQAADG